MTTDTPKELSAERLAEIFAPGLAMTWMKADELRTHIAALTARIAEQEEHCFALGAEIKNLRGQLEDAEARALAAETALKRVLLDIDFMVEDGTLRDIRGDIVYVEARSALAGAKP